MLSTADKNKDNTINYCEFRVREEMLLALTVRESHTLLPMICSGDARCDPTFHGGLSSVLQLFVKIVTDTNYNLDFYKQMY